MEIKLNRSELDFFLKVFRKGKRKIFIFSIIPTILLFGYMFFIQQTTYTAKTSLTIISQDPNSIMNSLGSLGLLGGLNLFSSGFSLNDNKSLVAIIQSSRVMKSTMLSKVTINDKEDLVVNHYLRLKTKFFKGRIEKKLIKNDSLMSMNNREDSLLQLHYEKFSADAINAKNDDNEGLIKLFVTTPNKALSIAISNFLTKNVEKFYYATINREKQLKIDIAKKRYDSLSAKIQFLNLELNKTKDKNINNIKNIGKANQQELERQYTFINALYSDAANSYEIAKQSLANKQQIIQKIDLPEFSVETNVPHPFLYSIGLFVLLYFGTSILFFLIQKQFYN